MQTAVMVLKSQGAASSRKDLRSSFNFDGWSETLPQRFNSLSEKI